MIHEIKIKAVLNGYIANVGCQTLVFDSREKMLKELDAYLEKPEETEKRYRESALNKDILNRSDERLPDAPSPTMLETGTPANMPDSPRDSGAAIRSGGLRR